METWGFEDIRGYLRTALIAKTSPDAFDSNRPRGSGSK